MPKIFLSYAAEDIEIAKQIAQRLKIGLGDDGWEIYDFQDPKQRGYKWIERIEEELRKAAAFLALVSPHYVTSFWCIHERDMALRQEAEMYEERGQFLTIAQVASVAKIGILGNYDWLDLTDKNRNENLEILIERFKGMETNAIAPASYPKHVIWPTFQNRREELDDLVDNLTNVSGGHFWQILSAPQMGKTWLLKQLAVELTEKDQTWHIVQVDLREQPIDARSNLSTLLALLFGQELKLPVGENQITMIARKVARQNGPWLCMLDSAELMDEEVALLLRETLSKIHGLVVDAGKKNVRLAFVAASRRRIPAWRGVVPYPRFADKTLSHFDTDVIEIFLREMAEKDECVQNARWYKQNSTSLYKASEGLPGLLVQYMSWIREAEYIFKRSDIEGRRFFNLLAKPYVKQYLLSVQSLLPAAGDSNLIEAQRSLLEKVLLALSIYRRFTEKYLDRVIENADGLTAELERANWKREELWIAVKRTYVMETSPDIWVRPYQSIRRLLFRYQNDTRKKRADAHKKAINFYKDILTGWTGTDKAFILVEYLWHRTESHLLSDSKAVPSSWLNFTDKLFEQGVRSDHVTKRDMATLIENCLLEDQELQEAAEEIEKGLFSKIVKIARKYNR